MAGKVVMRGITDESSPSRKQYKRDYYEKNKLAFTERNKKNRAANPQKYARAFKNWQLKKSFNISLEEYETLVKKQNECCACCGKHQSELRVALNVDHCHDTGKVRGLLCWDCNVGIGKLGDTEEGLQMALDYIRRS